MEKSRVASEAHDVACIADESKHNSSFTALINHQDIVDIPMAVPSPKMSSIDKALKKLLDYGYPAYGMLKLPTLAIHKNRLYCGQDDGTMAAMDLAKKQWLWSKKCHSNCIKMICVSNDGNFICSSSEDCLVIWRDEKDQKILFRGELNDFCISCDSKWLVTASKDRELALWSLEGGEQLGLLEEREMMLCLKATSQNILYSAGADNSIYLWDLNTVKLIKTLNGHTDTVNCLKLTNNEKWLLSGSNDGTIRIWDTTKNIVDITYTIYTGLKKVLMIEISPNDDFFASASNWSKIWSFEGPWKPFLEIKSDSWLFEQEPSIKYMKISIDSRFLITSSGDNQIQIYNINNLKKPVENLSIDSGEITGLYESIDPPCLIASSSNGIWIWNIEKRSFISSFSNCDTNEYDNIKIKTTKDGKYAFFALSIKNSIECWDLYQMKRIRKIEDPSIEIENPSIKIKDPLIKCEYIEITRDDKFLLSSSTDNNLKVWDISKLELIADLPAHINAVCLLYPTKDGSFLLSASEKGTIIVWEILRWNKITTFNVNTKILCIEESQKYIFCEKENFEISLWNKSDWSMCSEILKGHKDKISVLIADDEFLVSGSHDGTIKIWSHHDFPELSCLSVENFPVRCINLAKNAIVACSNWNKNIKIWDMYERYEVADLENPAYVNSFEIIHNEEFIVACLVDGKVVLWNFEEWNQVAVFIDYKRPLKILTDPSDDCMIIIGSIDRGISSYNVKHLVSDKSQWESLSIHTDDLCETMTSFSINNIVNPTSDEDFKKFYKVTIFPFRINCLHYFCCNDNYIQLRKALENNTPIIRDWKNSSPFTYAIKKNALRCISELFRFISGIEDNNLRNLYFHAIRNDILDLLKVKVDISSFLSCFLVKQKDEVIEIAASKHDLPIIFYSPTVKFNKKFQLDFTSRNAKKKWRKAQYWTSPFGYFWKGTVECRKLLMAIMNREELEIYNTDFVRVLIDLKWRYYWKWVAVFSILIWIGIFLMILGIFTHNKDILWYFWLMKCFYLGPTFYCIWAYKKGWWLTIKSNLLEILDALLFLWWMNPNIEDTGTFYFWLVVFNFLVGGLYFRAFNETRFYIRVIIRAIKDAIPFLIILLYSILGFSAMYASTDESVGLESAWRRTYELEAGNFDNYGYGFLQYTYFTLAVLINVIVLLNLLVTVLGDSFSRLKEVSEEIDYKEKLKLIIQMDFTVKFYVYIKKWLCRNSFYNATGPRGYMQICDFYQENKIDERDEGVNEMKRKYEELNIKMISMDLKIDKILNEVRSRKDS